MASEHECLTALRRAAEMVGESPTKAQYEDLGLTPSSATILRTIGGWNEAKTKAGLETAPSTGTRVASKPDYVELPGDLVWEELSVDQRWHYRNVERNTERTLRRRSRLRSWLNGRKRESGCARCGVDDPACLDFHHRNEREKTMDVGKMVTYGYGTDALREEIERCQVLCANCHRKHHYEPPSNSRRRWLHGRKRDAGGCGRCDEDDPACLDFHHVDDAKVDSIGKMVSNGRPKPAVRDEIERCQVLCANCHRVEHLRSPSAGSKNDNI